MLLALIYWWISIVVWGAFGLFASILVLRLIFNYTDPNPFGKIGRFGFKIRKLTEKVVYPAARFLATFRIDTRLAPVLTILIALVFTWFGLNIAYESFRIINKLGEATAAGNVKEFVGYVIYAALDVLILFIFIRFISSWFVFTRKTFLGFVMRVTNPIMLPFQRLIPPIGMFDISAMVVLILITGIQMLVLSIFTH